MEKKLEGVIEGTTRIVSDPYYFLHLMAFFSYLPICNSAAQEETWEAFFADTLLYAKRVAIWFCVIFSVIYLLAQQVAFSKLGTAKKLTPMQLEDLLSDGTTTKYWLIEFYACIGMPQLPTYILFEKGVEVSLFPDFYVDAAPSLPITKKLLCQHF
ncbi:hypothetical protein N665_0025s0335 [Sinapis alba]|nr:hypothetical protein N665_0025s0335 [Sinapis alba]